MRKGILKAVAVIVCFSILTLSAYGATVVEKKVKKFNFRMIDDKSMLALSSIFPFFTPIYDTGNQNTLPETNNTTGKKIKITGGTTKNRPPDGDD